MTKQLARHRSLKEAKAIKKGPTKKAIVERELSLLEKKHGHVTPEVVVSAATSAKHPLHTFFEWDDSVAGARYRLDQARQLIMTVRVCTELGQKSSVRALVPLYDTSKRFFSREAVLGDSGEREVQIERALSELRAWRRRWIDVKELDPIRKALKAHL